MKLVVILACVLCISVGKHFFTLLLIKALFMGRKQLFIGKPMETYVLELFGLKTDINLKPFLA